MLRKAVLYVIAVLALIAGPAFAVVPAQSPKAAAKPATVNWTQTFAVTPDGGMMIGNPKAPVHVLEYASLTCPHCAHFHQDSVPKLKASYIAKGQVKYEFRNFILNSPDFAASLLARCGGPQRFFALADAFFTRQPEWTAPFQTLKEEDTKGLEALPPERQILTIASLGKMDAFVRKRGVPKAMFDRCLSDRKQIDFLTKMRTDGAKKFNITGTPTVIVNGVNMPQVPSWEDLDQRIQSLLK